MQPGYRIEHYVLIEQIGQGGQATVWSAEDERLNRTVAIKVILPNTELNEQASTAEGHDSTVNLPIIRFRREAQIIADLEHPSILPIYTFGQMDDQLYIVMRYMAGGSLKKVLQHSPFSLERALEVVRPLADALDLAHQRGIIHRDIKSANVLMDARHHPYLADFGLSITVGDPTEGGAGTLLYMSPEQMSGDPIDHRSDLYAFGILLYEMLTGSVPLINGQPWNVQQILTGIEMPEHPAIAGDVLAVLRQATADQPDRRFQSGRELFDALAQTRAPSPLAEERSAFEPDLPLGLPITDPAVLGLLQANDLFSAALEAWEDGAGRFRFYADDFEFVDSFYRANVEWGIFLDTAGLRLMFRAALEHGYNLATWTDRLEEPADRRAVALQALGSEHAETRLRAMNLLQTIPDAEPPAIPARVSTIIGRDPEVAVRLEGLRVLERRAAPTRTWHKIAFTETVDQTLATLAVNDSSAVVREAAAKTCARVQSEAVIAQLAAWAQQGHEQAFRALVTVRDAVPALPRIVSPAVRRRVFVAVTVRNLLAQGIVGRFVGALLGFGIGWATIQYMQYTGRDLLPLQAAGNALASGLMYGAVMAVGIVATTEIAQRLHSWTKLGRVALAWVVGILLIVAGFATIRRFYYFIEEPLDVTWTLIPSAILAGGLALSSGLTHRPWVRSVVAAIATLSAVYISWLAYQAAQALDPVIMLSLDNDSLNLLLVIWLAITIGLFTFLPEWLKVLGIAARSGAANPS